MEKKNVLANTEAHLPLYLLVLISALAHEHIKCSLVSEMEFLQSKMLK